MKLFSKQILAKTKLKSDIVPENLQQYPKTEQWLEIVGIDEDAIKVGS